MVWLAGFLALLAFALPIKVSFRFGHNATITTFTWDGPEFFAAIIRRFRLKP